MQHARIVCLIVHCKIKKYFLFYIILLDVLEQLNVLNAHQAILGIVKLFNANQFALLANIGIPKMLHVKIVCLIVLRNIKFFFYLILLDVLEQLNVLNVHQAILGIIKLFNANQYVLLVNIGIAKMQLVKTACLIVLRKIK